MNGNDIFSIFPPVVLVFAFAISLAAVLVALDARDRGIRKEACVLWFFGIHFFPLIILLYLFLRNKKVMKPPPVQRSGEDEKKFCPYCRGSYNEGDRICPGCGRLL